ncbi:MAG: PAS domain S-box protein, partial [Bacteroidota bacterium]
MSAGLFKQILKKGLANTVPILQYRQILITNYLTLLSLLSNLVGAILSFSFSFYPYAMVSLIGGLLYAPVFILNERRHYQIASYYFIVLSTLIVISLSIASIVHGKDTDVEYVLFTILCVYVLLFDDPFRNYLYWFTFISLVGLRVFHMEWNELPYDYTFTIKVLNLFFISCVLFFFLRFFKRLLFRAVAQSNLHEKTLYSLIDNVPIYMAMVDKNDTYKIANEHYSNLFGMEKDDIIGKKRSKIVPKDIYVKQEPYIQQALQGKATSFLVPISMPDGQFIQARGKYFPVKKNQDEVEAVTIYVDDISEIKEVEDSLKRANETKDKLFSIIAHDVKSPLNLFQTLLNVSKEDELSAEDFFRYQNELKNK